MTPKENKMLVVRHHAKPNKYYVTKQDIENVGVFILMTAVFAGLIHVSLLVNGL